MNEFSFWQKWGLELDEKQFANAFLSLGILAASPLIRYQYSSEEDVLEIIRDYIRLSIKKDNTLLWRFPKKYQKVKIEAYSDFLFKLNPFDVASVWEEILFDPDTSIRIQILSFPKKEEVSPWFNLLSKTYPALLSAYILFEEIQITPHVKWPLRLGYFSGNEAEINIDKANFYWPSNELTRIVRIDRENANCDILFFNGSTGQLLKALLETPFPQKTNLLILRGIFEDNLNSMYQRLLSIVAECHANGIVILNHLVSDDNLGDAINRFIENLSHNESLDIAIFEAFSKSYLYDPVIFLNKDFARFKLEKLIENLHNRLLNLPETARPDIEAETFINIGIPENDIEEKDLKIPSATAFKLNKYRNSLRFDRESSGASSMAKMNKEIDHLECQISGERKEERFLQKQIFIREKGELHEMDQAFIKGTSTLIRIRIGPLDEKWDSIKTGFPQEKLPKDREEWRLSIIFTEPYHLKEPMRSTVMLPKAGPSSVCEFQFIPLENKIFEGRITVMHRGRILQTAILKGNVVNSIQEINPNNNISFTDIIHVRSNIEDLEGRRQFDLALLLNHTSDERPRLTAISSDHAWCNDLTESEPIVIDLNNNLSKIAKSVKDYEGGINSVKNRELLITLANLGNALYWSIVEERLRVPGNRPDIAGKEYIQIVSTKNDAIVPFEFIYDEEAPHNDANPCPSWNDALTRESCRVNCNIDKTKNVCPLGFWGIRKVIERHDVTPEFGVNGRELFIQSEPTMARDTLLIHGTAVLAASSKVEEQAFSPVIATCSNQLGASACKANNWENWADLVNQYKPTFLLALTHTDGNGINATLEIGGSTIQSNHIMEAHVRPVGVEGYPLVVLLGCDTSGTALEYGSHVRWFRRKGAGIVIGTIATVFGEHAANVAERLISGLKHNAPKSERLGEIIRSIKKQALLEGNLMPLCIVAYGDADWIIN